MSTGKAGAARAARGDHGPFEPFEPFSGISSSTNVPHLPHGRNPLSFCRRRIPWGFASQPARNHETSRPGTQQSHTFAAPSRDPLTTNFGIPLPSIVAVIVASWPRPCQSYLPSPPLLLLSLLARWAPEANFFHSFHSFFHAAFFPCARLPPSNLSFLQAPSLDSQPPFVLRVKCGPCGLQLVDRRGLAPSSSLLLPTFSRAFLCSDDVLPWHIDQPGPPEPLSPFRDIHLPSYLPVCDFGSRLLIPFTTSSLSLSPSFGKHHTTFSPPAANDPQPRQSRSLAPVLETPRSSRTQDRTTSWRGYIPATSGPPLLEQPWTPPWPRPLLSTPTAS